MKTAGAFILLLSVISSQHILSQTQQQFEERICELLSKSETYENVEKIVFLIGWDSEIIKQIPCISPVLPADFRNIEISSGYGQRYHPILNEYRHHSGIDIPGSQGDTVYVAATGKVISAGYNEILGNYVKVAHRFGFETIYGHLKTHWATDDQLVEIGEAIGLIGCTGRSTGPHLHYGVKKDGQDQDAYPYCFLLLEYLRQKNYFLD